jgi:signal transduction histidine kinase
MKNGGALSVKTHSSNNSITVSFINTGIGISEINLESIFEPLYSKKIKGFGLGLTISKNPAEAKNAFISIKSNPGQGTIWTILYKLKTSTI